MGLASSRNKCEFYANNIYVDEVTIFLMNSRMELLPKFDIRIKNGKGPNIILTLAGLRRKWPKYF